MFTYAFGSPNSPSRGLHMGAGKDYIYIVTKVKHSQPATLGNQANTLTNCSKLRFSCLSPPSPHVCVCTVLDDRNPRLRKPDPRPNLLSTIRSISFRAEHAGSEAMNKFTWASRGWCLAESMACELCSSNPRAVGWRSWGRRLTMVL